MFDDDGMKKRERVKSFMNRVNANVLSSINFIHSLHNFWCDYMHDNFSIFKFFYTRSN